MCLLINLFLISMYENIFSVKPLDLGTFNFFFLLKYVTVNEKNRTFICFILQKNIRHTYRVVCPNFGHPAPTSSFTKYTFLQVKNSFATIVNGLSLLKLFQN